MAPCTPRDILALFNRLELLCSTSASLSWVPPERSGLPLTHKYIPTTRFGAGRCGQAAYTPSCCCKHAVFKQAPVDRLLARRGSNQRWYDQAALESDSLA